jgi:hypothetical protein
MSTTKKKDELEQQQNQTVPAQSSTVQQTQSTQTSGRNYQSPWQTQINDTLNQYLNRDKFSYDVNADALYHQLRDQYRLMGQTAMMDTMGQAATLTGGYGNSYAHSVGQQAYQGYMQQLNDKVPDLYQMALDQYINEGNQMLDNVSLMMQMDDIGYGRYRDQQADQDAAYNKLMELMTTYGYKPSAEEMEAAGMTEEQMRAILGLPDPSAGSSGGSGSGVNKGGTGAYIDPNATNDNDGNSGSEDNDLYYKQLLGSVANAKGTTSKQGDSGRTYNESKAAINDAYANGKITAEQRDTLLGVATRGPR